MTSFWLDEPTILMKQDQLVFWPTIDMSSAEKLNAITRVIILLTILGFIFTSSANFLLMGAITLSSIVLYYKYNLTEKETFEQKVSNHTTPTVKNPMMNVLLPELNGNPNRKSALLSYTPKTHDKIMNTVKSTMDPRIYTGTNNELDLEYSMRQFYTTANTTVPNDQEGFGNFL